MSESIQVSKTKNNGGDIISSLPESIVSHILSFLLTKDAVRTCVLSKGWEYKWTNIDIINIDDRNTSRGLSTTKKSFVNFVDRMLLLCPVKRFYLKCWVRYNEGQMATWISDALRRNVERIVITCNDSEIVIPRCLFYSTSLTNLQLNMPCTLSVPVGNWFSHLKNLYLGRVTIRNEFSPNTTQLIFTFPVLESFELDRCVWLDVTLVEINAPSLNVFKSLSSKRDSSLVMSPCTYQIKICGATLTTFEASGYILENISLSESSVNYAAIGPDGMSGVNERLDGLQARVLMNEFSGLKRLDISPWILLGLAWTPRSGLPLPRFHWLKQLQVGLEELNAAFIDLLNASPSLETLILVMVNNAYIPVGDYDLEYVPPCVVSHLKEVKFHRFYGSMKQVQLAEYFLRNAPKLKKMLGLVRKKFLEDQLGYSFWVILKNAFENGDLELGDEVKNMADFESRFGGEES